MQRKISLVILGLVLMLFSSAVGVAATALNGPDSPTVSQYFQDVPNTNPFYANVSDIYEADIASGYACETGPAGPCVGPGNLPYYLPFANVTRGQMSKFVDNARTRPGIAIQTTADSTPYDTVPLSSRTGENTGIAIYGAHTSSGGSAPAILGETSSTAGGFLSAGAVGVQGVVSPTNAGLNSTAVRGINNGTSGFGIGVWGSHAGSGYGVLGSAGDGGYAVVASVGDGGRGVSSAAGDNGIGVYSSATGGGGIGVLALHSRAGVGGGTGPAVYAETKATLAGIAVRAEAAGLSYGVYARATGGFAVYGVITGTNGTGVYGKGPTWAGQFDGDISVTGNCTGCALSTYQIDDPTDPANKILNHAGVSSPERLNIYNGNVTTDASGKATVSLPSYFQALNKDFRYQLTVIGGFAQAVVSQEIANNKFVIATDKPNTKVSWQVTGVRNDPQALDKPVVVEQDKTADQKGKYLYPAGYGKSSTDAIDTTYGIPKPEPVVIPADNAIQGVISDSK